MSGAASVTLYTILQGPLWYNLGLLGSRRPQLNSGVGTNHTGDGNNPLGSIQKMIAMPPMPAGNELCFDNFSNIVEAMCRPTWVGCKVWQKIGHSSPSTGISRRRISPCQETCHRLTYVVINYKLGGSVRYFFGNQFFSMFHGKHCGAWKDEKFFF